MKYKILSFFILISSFRVAAEEFTKNSDLKASKNGKYLKISDKAEENNLKIEIIKINGKVKASPKIKTKNRVTTIDFSKASKQP